MTLIAIDPGNISGWAIFENRILISCGVYPARNADCKIKFKCDTLVIEKPKVYPIRQWKGDPNDLIHVAIIAGWFSGKIEHKDLFWATPQQWKGQTPKEIDNKRTVSLLTKSEQSVIEMAYKSILRSHRHNMLDAVGIGLWKLRRK